MSLFSVLSQDDLPTIEAANGWKPKYLSFPMKRLARIRNMHQYPLAMEILRKYSSRKIFKSSEYLKIAEPNSGGVLPFALLEGLAVDISIPNSNRSMETRRMHKICLKMDYDSRQFVLHYFFVATVHLAMPMGQFVASDFYNIDRSAEALRRTVHKNFVELPFKAEERASRAFNRDAWTICFTTY